jgi:hypothetical protein
MKLPMPPVPAGLVLLAAVLAVDLLYQSAAPPREFHPTPSTIKFPSAAPATHTGFVVPPAGEYSEIDERPIFSPQRKPMGSQLSDVDMSATGTPSNLALVGIITGPDNRIAILKTAGSAATQNVSVGGTIEGWRVTRIESNYIVLHQDSSDQDVKLEMLFNTHTMNTPVAQPGAQEQYVPPPVKGDDDQ